MSESAVNRSIFPCPVCEETFASPEEVILHGEGHDPALTYQYYVHEAGYVTEFAEDPATWTFVVPRSWTPAEFAAMQALEAAAAAAGVAQPPTIVAPGPMAAAQHPALAVAGLASRCRWVGCNAAFADDDQLYNHLDQQHVGAVGVRPRVGVCLWNGCAVGPHRDRAEMRKHLQHHAPDARPWFCNGGCGASFKHRYARASHHSVCAHEQARQAQP
ncbi:hypothetical protein D6D08_10195 [Aureobasidium pullulans]|nr:hypothetical protein D6D08_10195 [Aureobasidium pullulans]